MRFFQYIASRYIVENHEKIEQNRRFYRDLAHDYRFDKSQLIADFLPISRTWGFMGLFFRSKFDPGPLRDIRKNEFRLTNYTNI